MAENGSVYMADPWMDLATQHGQLAQGQVKLAEGQANLARGQGEIRHDVWSSAGNVRHDIADGVGNIRHDVGNGFADTRHDLCKTGGEILENVSNRAADIRYDVATRAGDIRREVATGDAEIRSDVGAGFCDTRRDLEAGFGIIRREQEVGFGNTKYAIAEHSEATNRDVLTTGYQTRAKVDEAADKILQRSTDYFIAEQARDLDAARDLTAIRAKQELIIEKTVNAVQLGQAALAKEIAENKYLLSKEMAENKYDLSKQVAYENEKTRDLINSLKNDELNRLLIERNTDLQHCRHDYWGARDGLFNSQFAALSSQVNSQLNALNSQIAETRQGMVNFGTMAGVGQSSTSNAVR